MPGLWGQGDILGLPTFLGPGSLDLTPLSLSLSSLSGCCPQGRPAIVDAEVLLRAVLACVRLPERTAWPRGTEGGATSEEPGASPASRGDGPSEPLFLLLCSLVLAVTTGLLPLLPSRGRLQVGL